MGSVFIALDPAVKENGCLQVLSFLYFCSINVTSCQQICYWYARVLPGFSGQSQDGKVGHSTDRFGNAKLASSSQQSLSFKRKNIEVINTLKRSSFVQGPE